MRLTKEDKMRVETIERILETNGLGDALQALQELPRERDNAVRLLACAFARAVRTEDPRVAAVLRVAERHARNDAFNSELTAARNAAKEAPVSIAAPAVAAAGGDAAEAAQDAAAAAAWWFAQEASWEATQAGEPAEPAWWSAWDTARHNQAAILRAWLEELVS